MLVISARHLPVMDFRSGLADPYVVVTVGAEQRRTQIQVGMSMYTLIHDDKPKNTHCDIVVEQ